MIKLDSKERIFSTVEDIGPSNSSNDDGTKVIGIEIAALRSLVREVVHTEVSRMTNHIISVIKPSDHQLKEGVEYNTNQVAAILGVTRNTIRNYRIEGILPEPGFNLSGRPVWSAEQIVSASRQKGIKTKFDL
jgi:hypothetical protein